MRTNNMCPTGPEFQALVNHPQIGRFEAMREWLEQDGNVRPVSQVLAKLNSRKGVTPHYELLKFLNGFGFEIEEAENLIINLAAKKITVNPYDTAQMAKALAAPLSEMLSYRGYFFDIQQAIRKSSKYKQVRERIEKEFTSAFAEKNGPHVKQSQINRIATKEIFRELLEKGFNERFAQEAGIEKSMLDKIIDFIKKLVDRISGVEWDVVTANINEIVENTFKGSDFIRVTEKEGYKKVAFQEAFDQNDIAKDIMTKIGTDPNIVLTGSIAYSTQGTVYRKIESVVHDLDFVNLGLTSEEIEQKVMSNYPESMRAYTFFDKYLVETYLIPPKGLRIQNLQRRPNGTKIIYYELVNDKDQVVGTYTLKYDLLPNGKITNEEEIKTGKQAMLVDFFSNDTMERNILRHDFIGSDGKTYSVNLSQFEEPFTAKLSYSRLKDIWDYNRFIPNDVKPYVPEQVSDSVTETMVSQALPYSVDVESTEYTRANEISRKLMAALSAQTGVDYEIVTPQQAAEMTQGTRNPYNGEAAFFFNGKAYFVNDRLNTETVFHEFAHPIIRQLSKSNPELFKKLYMKVAINEPLMNAIRQNYPEFNNNANSSSFMEEVIVTALAYYAQNQYMMPAKELSGIAKVIQDILAAIKQLFRKAFGNKIDISKLSVDTTLEDLGQMLVKGGNFKIETEAVSDADVVAYQRSQTQKVNDLAKVAPERMRQIAVRGFEVAKRQVNLIRKNKNYREMLNVLADEFNRGDLNAIKENLAKYAIDLETKMDELLDSLNYNQSQAEAIINTYYRLQQVFTKLEEHMKKMALDPNADQRDNMQKAFYYNGLVKYWQGFIAESISIMNSTPGITKDNELYQLVAGLDSQARSINNLVQDFYSEGVRDTLMDNLRPMARNMQDRFDSVINTLRKNGASQASIDRQYKEYYGMPESDHKRYMELRAMKEAGTLTYDLERDYDKLRRMSFMGLELTEEKLEEILKGKLGDVNWANGYLEGVLYSDDPVVGGFGLYVSNAMNEVMTRSQMKYNKFANAIRGDLEKVGYNPTNIGELGKRVGFVDTIASYDYEQEKMVEKKLYTFLNPWKEYRYKVDMMEDNIRKARRKYLQTNSPADKKALIDAIEDKRTHDKKYMHQEYVPEYYEFRDKLMRDDIGKLAFYERDNIIEEVRSLQEKTPDSELFQIQDQVDELWRKYKLLHSLYDKDGYKKKSGDPDPYKNLEIAQRLQEYSKGSRKFYKYVERPGLFDNAFIKFKQSLLNRGLNPDDSNDIQAQSEIARWLTNNMRVSIKPEFFQKRQKILDRIAEIMAKYPERQVDADEMQKAWELIFDNVAAFRDQDNQPNASLMSEGRIANVKAAQEYISNLKAESFNSYLEEEDAEELSNYFDMLAELQTKVPTEYYLDQVNRFLKEINSPLLQAEIGMNYLDASNIDLLYRNDIIEELVELSPEFANWFKNNHMMHVRRNYRGEYVQTFERLYVWNVVKPNDEAYYETYDIKDENGDVLETLPMIPSTRYYARVIKDEYKTGYVAPARGEEKGKVKLVVGVHIDNKGNWLPRMDVKNSPYRNEEYYRVQKEEPDLFRLLEKLKEFHLEHQKGLSADAKLYLDFPRFEKTGLESMRTRNKLGDQQKEDDENWFQWLIRRIKDFFNGSKDMPESGFNQSDEFRLATLDMFDNETTKIPMQGLYDIDHLDVSTDITNGMLRYMLAAERNKKLVEINPTARALQSVLENNNLKDITTVSRQALLNNGVITYANSKEKYLRKQFVDALIEREFEGQFNAGYGKDSKFLHNLSQGLFQTASLGFFALNIPSALKNWFGAKYQGMIEGAAGRYFNMKDFAAAEAWSMKTMMEVSAQIYKKENKSKDVQIWEVFNPVYSLESKFRKEGLSRSLAKDVSNMSWLMNFRKWTEMQASMQIFGAYMKRQQVEKKDGTKMDYLDAWELNDQGQIQLKSDVKPEYGITYDQEGNQVIGDVFKSKQQEIQAVLRNLQGAYDSFNQPEAQRYLAFRFVSYLRRFFTTMFIDRFGFKPKMGKDGFIASARLQPGLGTAAEGWYVTMAKFFADVTRSGPKRFTYLLPDEKRAFLKFTTDVVALYIMFLLQSILFDWDPEDEDRYEKLRQKSGAMRAPFVTDDEYSFNMGGWLSNHALNLLIQTQAEQYQFMPIPGLGFKQYMEFTDLSSIAFGPTLNNYATMVQDLTYLGMGDKRAYYQAEVGPYTWQQDGGLKFLAHMFGGAGITGTFWAPEQALKNYMSIQGRK